MRNQGVREDLKRSFAEDAIARALRKFRGDYGFRPIQFRHRKSGFKLGNPYNELVWDALLKAILIEKHKISNVDDGGLNVIDDREIRKEIAAFLDNGVPGVKLKKVVDDLVS